MTTIAGRIKEQRAQWDARWCWTEEFRHPWNTYVYFRKLIDLPGTPRRAIVRMSADARYTLFVNGHRVHQGPARCYQGRQSFDTLDLSVLFHPGKNVVAAIGHQFGVSTFQSVFRDASGFFLDGVVECDGGPVPLHTPDGWICRNARGWRQNVARQSIQLGFQEHFDADADPPDWMSDAFEPKAEDDWVTPWNQGPVGTNPWLLMEPRGVPLLADHVESIAAVVAQFRGENPRGYKVVEDVYHLVDPGKFKKDNEALENPAAMLRDDDEPTTVPVPPEGEFIAATLDLGTYRTGHFMLDIADAAGDEIIDVLFSEEIEKSQLPMLLPTDSHSHESQALRYRCRPGAQKWEAFHYVGMRYALIIFRNVENKPLKIRRIAVRQVHTAVEQIGQFQCSDDRLTQIWNVARHTQLNCSFDAFVDCPWREQAMWWGDSRVQAKVMAHAFGDISLLERGIRLIAQSQTPDGALHAHAPADLPRHRLPDFMMTWIGTLWDHHFHTGRTDLIVECLPTVHRLLEFFQSHESAESLIGSFDGFWMFLDWQQVFKGDYSAPFNLMYLQSLRWASELCRLGGEDDFAAEYEQRAAKLQTSIEKYFWDDKAKSWRDGFDIKTAKPVEQMSQHTTTLAILLGLKPETHANLLRQVLLKSATSKRTKILTASPYFYAYVLQVLAGNGLRAEAIEIIREKWGEFLEQGSTTFYELWEVTTQSRCHAWSSSPLYHLMEIVLGVSATEPGWKRVKIAPFPGTLDYARGVVPTPRGPIRVEWERAGEDEFAVRVDLPDGVIADFISPTGEKRELETGGHEFHM
jgi:alpha-L-rhamnosidase